MAENQNQSQIQIEPGIYKHFKGKLYFVLGLAWSRNDPTDPAKAEVIYHPLYQVENLGWRRDITLEEFLEHIDCSEPFNYSGPRFVKVLDWECQVFYPGKLSQAEILAHVPLVLLSTMIHGAMKKIKLESK